VKAEDWRMLAVIFSPLASAAVLFAVARVVLGP
jgi:hypothetical protein